MTDVSDRPTGPSRRTLVRAGAALGWTAPVLLTAVPAHAACVSPNAAARLVATVGITRPSGASGATARNRTFNVTVENQGGTYTGEVAIRLSVDGARTFSIQISDTPDFWTRDAWIVLFTDPVTYTRTGVNLACGGTLTFTVTLRVEDQDGSENDVTFGTRVTAGSVIFDQTGLPAIPA